MTHGVESGPETQQDSAALTYLEGLLMHPVSAAIAAQRSDPGHSHEESADEGTRPFLLSNHSSSSAHINGPSSSSSQHLKKARLLRSGVWSANEQQEQGMEVDGARREQCRAGLDGGGQGESTLLASLLQSFSSRLQSVALSQHISQSCKQLDSSVTAAADQQPYMQGYSTASGHLKSLMKKSKQQNHNAVPYCRQNVHRRSTQPTGSESMSCTDRLKAVASMVRTRTSPAPPPKPSVACSQLALLLSSEAHLQQYSQEQALRAQVTSRSASERLAAMATQQTQDVMSPCLPGPDLMTSLNVQNGTMSQPFVNCSQRSPSLPSASPRPFKERRPPPNCSSLLLLLLKNHNTQKQLTRNGHLEEDYRIFPTLQSDSEYSSPDCNVTKDNSHAESLSSCSPIDLSMKGRGSSLNLQLCSSPASPLRNREETPLSKVNTVPFMPKAEDSTVRGPSLNIKPRDEATLMQLLLDSRNREEVNMSWENPGFQSAELMREQAVVPLKRLAALEEGTAQGPLTPQTTGRLTQVSRLSPGSPSHLYSFTNDQSSPLDLCKAQITSADKIVESSFSASKLLQNLAQSGLKNVAPSPLPPLSCRRQSPDQELLRPQAPSSHQVERCSLASSQIENLLEKRTVLQLLLGTASQRERVCLHKDTDASAEKARPGSIVQIKVEPVEKDLSPDDGACFQRQSPCLIQAQDKIKSERCPTETAARFGLLSQLLNQQSPTYQSSGSQTKPLFSSVKEESLEIHSHAPKKRKMCLELAERLSNELCQQSGDAILRSDCSGGGQNKLKDEEDQSSQSKRPHSRESHGFNVLKQLLLSESCETEVSRPTGTFTPLSAPWYPKPEGSGRVQKDSPSSPDSPPLTRSNPILYCMLQETSVRLRATEEGGAEPQNRVMAMISPVHSLKEDRH